MAKRSPAHVRAVARYKDARAALIRRNLATSVTVQQQRFEGRQAWGAGTFNSRRIDLPTRDEIPGHWYLQMHWLYVEDPGAPDPILAESSISLNVFSALTNDLNTNCLVRYDADMRRDPSLHLNVLQPAGLEDKVHYPVPGLAIAEWPLEDIVGFLLSEDLRRDLRDRLP